MHPPNQVLPTHPRLNEGRGWNPGKGPTGRDPKVQGNALGTVHPTVSPEGARQPGPRKGPRREPGVEDPGKAAPQNPTPEGPQNLNRRPEVAREASLSVGPYRVPSIERRKSFTPRIFCSNQVGGSAFQIESVQVDPFGPPGPVTSSTVLAGGAT